MLHLFKWIDKLIWKYMEWRGPRHMTPKEVEEMVKRKAEIEQYVKEGR